MFTMTNQYRNNLLLVVAMLFTLCVSCDDAAPGFSSLDNASGIVNGTPTNYESWTGVVALSSQDGSGMCTGTLIGPGVVQTAGHCVYKPSAGIDHASSPADYRVSGGANVITNPIIIANADFIEVHPDWNGSSGVDLALVFFSDPAIEIEYYPLRPETPETGEMGHIVGYGLASSSDLYSSGIHREGDTTLLFVNETFIEIGNPSNGCMGDSGGPLFTLSDDQTWELAGVISHGTTQECLADSNGICVNLSTYLDWVNEILDENPDYAADADEDTDTDTDEDAGENVDAGVKGSNSCTVVSIGHSARTLQLLPTLL